MSQARRAKDVVVMKFGGTSVADPEKIQRAAERAIAARRQGKKVVAVLSAPGDMTDELIALAGRLVPAPGVPDGREMDMLLSTGEQVAIALFAMAVKARGSDAVSLTGPMAGIEADARHTSARILRVRPARIRGHLSRGRIVAVAGFQGETPQEDIATLGRGGSDMSAVALAAALGAGRCEIFTDVKGVYTAPPSVVPEAKVLARVSWDEMLELASSGAQVMQPRSIELARRLKIAIHVRSSFAPEPGTWIVGKAEAGRTSLLGLALDLSGPAARVSIIGTGLGRRGRVGEQTAEILSREGVGSKVLSASERRISIAVAPAEGERALRRLHAAFGLSRARRDWEGPRAAKGSSLDPSRR